MEDFGNDWDLNAVVRGYSTTASDSLDPFHSYSACFIDRGDISFGGGDDDKSMFPDSAIDDLEELCRPFFLKPRHLPQETKQEQAHRPKRKKNQQKKVVCEVPAADASSSDMWAWRKYGQKPIKGSPYPRGYYRCSSLKGCLARKQVERSQNDPKMLIITYTGEHNHPVPTHRNSLAGSTRNKLPPPQPNQNFHSNNKTSSPLSTLTMTSLSPTTSLTASMDDELLKPRDEQREEEDKVFKDLEMFGGDIDDDDFVNKFFSSLWKIENTDSVEGR